MPSIRKTNARRRQAAMRARSGVIRWSLRPDAAFRVQRPLSDKTMARIQAGARKFLGAPSTGK